jgi:hypothetical protein
VDDQNRWLRDPFQPVVSREAAVREPPRTATRASSSKTEEKHPLVDVIQKYEKEAAFNIAYVLAFRGEADRAFEWLDKAVTYRDPGLAEIAVQPWFANLHQDPRWLPFLRKLRFWLRLVFMVILFLGKDGRW